MGAGGLGEAQLENLGCRLRRKNHPEAHEEWGTDSCLAGEEGTGTASAERVRMGSRGLRKERFEITVREGKYQTDGRSLSVSASG